MNLPTDLPDRMKLNKERREMTANMRKDIRQRLGNRSGEGSDIALDHLPILLENVEFKYGKDELGQKLNLKGRLEISQGSLVGLMGHHGEGKSTLLKLLG